jgi:hypothetical protein
MNFFGVSNNTLSIILYIVTILVLVIFGIVVSTTLKNYINNIPEKKRTFLQKFLSDTVARNIIIIGGAFLILKFIIDPLFNYIFPAIAIGGSLLGGNDNDDQKDIEINTNNNVENNNNLSNLETLQSIQPLGRQIANTDENTNNLPNLETGNVFIPSSVGQTLGQTLVNNDDEKTAEISENNNVNNEETTLDLTNQSISNLVEPFPLPRENNNEENIESNNTNNDEEKNNVSNVQNTANTSDEERSVYPNATHNDDEKNNDEKNNDEEKDNPQTGGTKKTRGRPKKIKSAAKVKLGKTNKWAIAVKRARKALGLTGFVPLSKGGLFYKTSKSFYYELTH